MWRRHLPNLISLARLLVVFPVVILLLDGEFGWALALFALAGISDGLDGYLAKHYGWQSRLGGILDPLADKSLLLAVLLVLGYLDLIPIWLVAVAILRDLVIIGGAVAYLLLVEDLDAVPLLASKLNTLLQILLVVAVIVDAGLSPLPTSLIIGLTYACLITITVSGSQYVYVWSRRASARGWPRYHQLRRWWRA